MSSSELMVKSVDLTVNSFGIASDWKVSFVPSAHVMDAVMFASKATVMVCPTALLVDNFTSPANEGMLANPNVMANMNR